MSDNFLENYKQLGELSPAAFAEIWQNYDRDSSGFIEAGPELERLLTDMLRACGEELTELKIRDFTAGVLEMFDVNTDGKLSRVELETLLRSE